jgi:hypothetical protein
MSKIAIPGGQMYLFRNSEFAYARRLVISAHGGIRKTLSPTFRVLTETLVFYSDHGVATDDFGLANFATGGKAGQKKQTINPGQVCYDYELSKYQGKHNKAGETYDSIDKNQKYAKEMVGFSKGMKSQYTFEEYDVLTIRNRHLNGPGVTLKKALDTIRMYNNYQEIHCYFCRSFYFY